MTPRERYDAAVEATRLLSAVFNDLLGANEDLALRRELFVAASGAERIAAKLHVPAFDAPPADPPGEPVPERPRR